jgi:hypothetical protein
LYAFVLVFTVYLSCVIFLCYKKKKKKCIPTRSSGKETWYAIKSIP